MKERYPVGVGVGVLVFDGDKTLMQLRAGAHGSGTWAPPGGKVDPEEHPFDTAKREVQEETGLLVEDVEMIGFTNDVFT